MRGVLAASVPRPIAAAKFVSVANWIPVETLIASAVVLSPT